MPVGFSALMCHAPIVVPAVGGSRGSACAQTTAAMRHLARRVAQRDPSVLVVLSPHTARLPDRFGLLHGDRVKGDFAAFGAASAGIDLPAALSLRERLLNQPALVGIVHQHPLDHGALVPLWFVAEAGYSGPTLVIALPWQENDLAAMGAALAEACEGEDAVVVASGDMSHRLTPGAPAGYHPRGADFDPQLREIAAEDVVSTVLVAAHSRSGSDGCELLCYEGPFGVGYAEAVLASDGRP